MQNTINHSSVASRPAYKMATKPQAAAMPSLSGPSDSFQSSPLPEPSSMKQAFVTIGKAVSTGGLLGFSAALAVAGAATLAPAAGAIVAGGLIIAGGIQGVATFGESATKITGDSLTGKLVAGATGAGMAALCTGLGPASSVVAHSLQGYGIGAMFGLVQAGAQNKPH